MKELRPGEGRRSARTVVLKIGGVLVDDPAALAGLARAVLALPSPPVIVHGGGRAIGELQAALGIPARKLDGLRITDDRSRDVARMVLSGLANERIVAALIHAGLDARGMSGVDRALLRCDKLRHPGGDLGWVGTVRSVRSDVLAQEMDNGVVPVVSPISLGGDGEAYNVNADSAAAAIAAALAAELYLVCDVPGVAIGGAVVERLDAGSAAAAIERGEIREGMVPKVRAGLEAIDRGATAARIIDLPGLIAAACGGEPLAGTEIGGVTPVASKTDQGVPHGKAAVRAGSLVESGARSDEGAILAADAAHMLQAYARPPLVIERGDGAWLYAADGRRYLDFTAGIAVTALGHSDPEWVAAVRRQAGRLVHTSNLFHTAPQARLAARLAEVSFADRVFLCNSGTEAIEAAIKFARRSTPPERTEFVAFEGAFHGRSVGSLSLTHKAAYREPFGPLMPGVRFVPFGDLDAALAAIGPGTCAVFVEPIQGEAGYRVSPPGFLAGLRAACEESGARLVFDEVQCGLGRTGRLWAHENWGVTPDIMAIAKPLAGGLPVGAALVTESVARALSVGDHGTTFGGGPLVCRAAEVVLERVAQPAFLAEVRDKGLRLVERLEAQSLPHLLELRGLGLMVGVEFDVPVKPLVEAARELGLLLVSAGPNTVRLCPPLVVSRAQIDHAAEVIGVAVDALATSRVSR